MVNAGIDVSACPGTTVQLNAAGAASYSWTTGAGTATMVVDPPTTTQFMVEGTGTNGCIARSAYTVSVDACLGISSRDRGQFRIFPNPSSGECFADAPTAGVITVVNSMGQTILQAQVAPGISRLNLAGAANGLYVIFFDNAGIRYRMNIVKQ